MKIKYISRRAPKGQAIALELLYWLARILSTVAVWSLSSHIFINIAISTRGYCDVGSEYIPCILASFIWFYLFKIWFKGDDKQ